MVFYWPPRGNAWCRVPVLAPPEMLLSCKEWRPRFALFALLPGYSKPWVHHPTNQQEDLQRGYFDDFREFRDQHGKVFESRLIPVASAQPFPTLTASLPDESTIRFPVSQGAASVTLVAIAFRAGAQASPGEPKWPAYAPGWMARWLSMRACCRDETGEVSGLAGDQARAGWEGSLLLCGGPISHAPGSSCASFQCRTSLRLGLSLSVKPSSLPLMYNWWSSHL